MRLPAKNPRNARDKVISPRKRARLIAKLSRVRNRRKK